MFFGSAFAATMLQFLDHQHRSFSDKGQVLLEFALVAALLSMLVAGAINYGWIIYRHGTLVDIARDAARYGASLDTNQTLLAESRMNFLPLQAGLDASSFEVSACCRELLASPLVYGVETTVRNIKASCLFMCLGDEPNPTARATFRLQVLDTGSCNPDTC